MKPHIFLSWHGTLSHEVAKILSTWLRNVIQGATVFLSSSQIKKGSRWSRDLAEELEKSTFGIICLTADNSAAPWLNFEAGALSKTLDVRVAPLLIDLEPGDFRGPLKQFQTTSFTAEDILELVRSINSSSSEAVPDNNLEASFRHFWPELETQIEALRSDPRPPAPPQREPTDVRQEILDIYRRHDAAPAPTGGRGSYELAPTSVIREARYAVDSVLDCHISESFDPDGGEPMLSLRAGPQVAVRRIVVLADDARHRALVAQMGALARENENYEVRSYGIDGQNRLGEFAFSVVDRTYVVIRVPGGQPFAVADGRAAHVLGRLFEKLWADLPAGMDQL
ncbi:toll/interleukin-1 receptor domain-containing protein [Actinoplanes sp. NPDC004185]